MESQVPSRHAPSVWGASTWVRAARMVRAVMVALGCDVHAVLAATFILARATTVPDWPGAVRALKLGPPAWSETGAGHLSDALDGTRPSAHSSADAAAFAEAASSALGQGPLAPWAVSSQAAILLACKSTEQVRRLRDIINAAQSYLIPDATSVALDSGYATLKSAIVVQERVLLTGLAFDLRSIPESPYTEAAAICERSEAGSNVLRGACALLSDGGLVLRMCIAEGGTPAASANSIARAACAASASWCRRGGPEPTTGPWGLPGIGVELRLDGSEAALASEFEELLRAVASKEG